jgi:hypothetical protein
MWCWELLRSSTASARARGAAGKSVAARAGEWAGKENGESVVRFFHEIDDLFLRSCDQREQIKGCIELIKRAPFERELSLRFSRECECARRKCARL